MTENALRIRAKIIWSAVLVSAILLAGGTYRYFQTTKSASGPKNTNAAIPVVTTLVGEEDVPVYLSGIGNVAPLYAVTVKVRVDGHLDTVAFTEGQTVKAGDLLAQIDPRPFQAQLQQAQAQKARDEALLKNAQMDLERYTLLWQQDSVSRQIYDTQRTNVEQLKATVQADQAQVDTAKLQLEYTSVRAPISGRTGARLVDPGNIVRAADSGGIVVINQIDPIAVVFTLPEDKFQSVNRAARESKKPLPTIAYAREDATLLSSGKLTLINNQIDTATGTVQFKAVFPNRDQKLWPGQYVNTRIVLGTRQKAVTVAASVVQRGPNGLFAYVVNAEETVSMQALKVSYIQEGKAVIEDGLAAGDRVVVDGQYKLKPGSKITEFRAPEKKQNPSSKESSSNDSSRRTSEKK